MTCWKIAFFEIESDQNLLRSITGETTVSCGIAELFSMGNTDQNQGMNLYIADKEKGAFVCHKSVLPPDSGTLDYIVLEQNIIKTKNIKYIDINSKYTIQLENVCKACCSTKKTYNTIDRCTAFVLHHFVEIQDVQDIYSTDTLHSAQAVVLIMRAILDTDDPFYSKIKTLNSRATTPSSLFSFFTQSLKDQHTTLSQA